MVLTRVTLYAGGVIIIVVAWILNVTQLYWMAGMLFLLPHATRLFARLEHQGIEIRRQMPLAGQQGELVEIRLRSRNKTALPKLHLSVADALPAGVSALDPDPIPIHLIPYGEDEISFAARLGRRGLHLVPGVRVTSTDLLGLTTVETEIPMATQVLVYPRHLELPPEMLPPELGGGQAPLDTAQRQGEGSSFFGIREYRPGDPLRHVHWRTAARLGRLAVVEWEAEQSVDALIAVETSGEHVLEMEDGTTLDLAAGVAASLARMILSGGDSVRLLAPGFTEWRATAERGLEALPGLLDSLARMDVSDQSLAVALRQVAPHLAPGTVVCCLTARLNEAFVTTTRYLQSSRLRPVVYLLEVAERGQGPASEAVVAELESIRVPVIRLHPNDELVRRLLS